MAIATVTAQQIIVNAIRMLNIFGEQFEDIPGHVETQALQLFNENLNSYASHGLEIPFYTVLSLALVEGQQEYQLLSDGRSIVELLYVNTRFPNTEQRYPVDIIEPGRLFKRNFNLDSQSRPQEVFLRKEPGTSTLVFYPVPDQAYTAEIRAKVELDNLKAQDLVDEVPIYWQKFLRYELARELKNFFPKATWTPLMEQEYQRQKIEMYSASPIDLTPDLDDGMLDRGNFSIKNGVWQ